MTTIAYRSGILAADTLLTAGDTKLPERGRKVFRLRDGRLFAAAGRSEEGMVLLDALKRGEPMPRLKGVIALMVHPDGRLECYEGTRWSRVTGADYAAIGNGSHYALGAMAFGATAKEAVRIGMKLDTHSGGRVHAISLRRAKPRSKRTLPRR